VVRRGVLERVQLAAAIKKLALIMLDASQRVPSDPGVLAPGGGHLADSDIGRWWSAWLAAVCGSGPGASWVAHRSIVHVPNERCCDATWLGDRLAAK
jgi:hypothetical protein